MPLGGFFAKDYTSEQEYYEDWRQDYHWCPACGIENVDDWGCGDKCNCYSMFGCFDCGWGYGRGYNEDAPYIPPGEPGSHDTREDYAMPMVSGGKWR
jgi:hypothetical protein